MEILGFPKTCDKWLPYVSRIAEGKTASQIIEDVHVLKAIKPLRKVHPRRPSSSALKNVGFDVGDMSIINEEIDTEF